MAGESHEDSNLAGDSPKGHKESDMTEQLSDLGIKPSSDKQDQKARREARFSGYHSRLRGKVLRISFTPLGEPCLKPSASGGKSQTGIGGEVRTPATS